MPPQRFRDRTGPLQGTRLTITGFGGTKLVRGRLRTTWNCLCSCGTTKSIDSDRINRVKSCGCLRRETGRAAAAKLPRRVKGPVKPRAERCRTPILAELSRQSRALKAKRVQPRSFRMHGKSRPNTWARADHLGEFAQDSTARKEWFQRMSLIGRLVAWKHSVRYASHT
jgi:hypothetical protein